MKSGESKGPTGSLEQVYKNYQLLVVRRRLDRHTTKAKNKNSTFRAKGTKIYNFVLYKLRAFLVLFSEWFTTLEKYDKKYITEMSKAHHTLILTY